MFDLESSIKEWLKSFSNYQAYDHGSVREMELHLRDHIEDLLAEGYTEKEAFEEAVKDFGDIKPVAREEFSIIKAKKTVGSLLRLTMFRNYSKTSIRSLMRNPLNSFINIFGLSMAIGICLLVYGFAKWTYSMDDFHINKDKVYLTTFFADREGTLQQNGRSPRPLGEMLRQDFPQIEKICRVEDRNVVIKYEEHVFHEKIRYADPEFLEMFTFPLKWGSSKSLGDLNSIILSEEKSIKYFGDNNPVGKDILIKYDKDRSGLFTVSGVAKEFPNAHAVHFDFLINYKNLESYDLHYDLEDWSKFVNATLIEVNNPTDLKIIEEGMDKYRLLQNEVQQDWKISSFKFVQLAVLYESSVNIRNGISGRGFFDNQSAVIILSLIAIFLLALACLNYINIAIVSAAKRLKEIGLRKVIGASRRMVISQFLTENIVIILAAMALGFALGNSLIIPWFGQMNNFEMNIEYNDLTLWIFLAAVLLITALLSGFYPALYISKFQVVTILKGTVKFGKKNPLTKLFLGFQLILACVLIALAVMFTQNTGYVAKRSWGYNQHETLYMDVPDLSAYEQLSTAMLQNPNVLSISGSSHHLGRDHTTTIVKMPYREYEVNQLSVDENYFSTMGIEIKEGRNFRKDQESDKQGVLINESLVRNLSIGNTIGELFKIDSVQYEVIGVVKDFHMYNFHNKIPPTLFLLADKEDYRYLSMKVTEGKKNETYLSMQEQWAQLFPEIPFQGGHQEDTWAGYFKEIGVHGRFWRAIALMAILLASLGLYGLVTLNVTGRIREFSVRKVLGADLRNIASNIIQQYVLLFVVALIIGAFVSYPLVGIMFEMAYSYHIPINPMPFILAVVILILVLLMVVSAQVGKISKSNPVEGLKVE